MKLPKGIKWLHGSEAADRAWANGGYEASLKKAKVKPKKVRRPKLTAQQAMARLIQIQEGKW